jgi:lantibiotic modifying enzyme
LRAVDLHAGNWIACGAQPVLIDSETLLHTATRIPAEFRKNETDLLRTGMLPKGSSRDPSREVSALGRLVPGSHLLRMRRKPVPACDFAPSIINGFLAMHDLFRKRGLSVESLTGLLGLTSTRRIYRPTSLYTLFERRSHSPAIMRSGLERSLILQAACHDGAVSRPRAGQEALALEQGDIPIFHGAPAAPRPLRTAREIRRSLDLLKQALRSSAY